jgi:hypothetical protein
MALFGPVLDDGKHGIELRHLELLTYSRRWPKQSQLAASVAYGSPDGNELNLFVLATLIAVRGSYFCLPSEMF